MLANVLVSWASPGAGKSQALMAVMGLLPPNARTRGSIRFDGRELLGMPRSELNALRGASMSMVFQDPLTSFTPHLTVGDQIAEPLVRHTGCHVGGCAQERCRIAGTRARHRSCSPRAAVSSRAVRRDAPARDDRDGARVRPEARHRR